MLLGSASLGVLAVASAPEVPVEEEEALSPPWHPLAPEQPWGPMEKFEVAPAKTDS